MSVLQGQNRRADGRSPELEHMRIVSTHSVDPDTPSAMTEILQQAAAALGDDPVVAGIAFVSMDADHDEVVARLRAAYPGIELIGCTTDGELSSRLAFQEDSIAVALFAGEGLDIRAGVGPRAGQDVGAAARAAVAAATRPGDGPVKLCVTLPESLTMSGAEVVHAIAANLPPEVPIVGGTAADQWAFQGTRQLCGDTVYSDALPVLLFRGEVDVSVGVASGWTPMGRRGVVTKVDGNVVHTIDDVPALSFFHSYLGGKFTPDPEHPVAVIEDDGFYLRAPVGMDEASGSITFFGDIPQGAVIQISETVRSEMLDACDTSIRTALDRLSGAPVGALIFSCAARKQLLGTRTGQEYERLAEAVGESLPTVGFYSYGEIGPLKACSESHFHNETFVTVLFGGAA